MVDKNTQATPDVDILELPDELVIQANLPGCTAEGIDIEFNQGTLSVRGKVASRERPGFRRLWQEYGVGDYHRTFRVGTGVDTDEIDADYSNGLLTLRLPKSESAKPRKIAVGVGAE